MRKIDLRSLLLLAVTSAMPAAMLVYTDTYKEAVSEALYSCANVLIPSLFPFFVLSSFTVYTGGMSVLTRRMGLFAKLLRVPKEGLNAVILCLLGGFPVGAKTAAVLYSERRISSEQAEKLICCCVGAGPGFLVTFLGESMIGSKQAGFLLLISNILSVLTLLLFYPKIQLYEPSKPVKSKSLSLGEAVVLSTEQAVHTAFSMCGFVIIFTVINKLLLLTPVYNEIMSAALEITCGTIYSTGKIPLELTAFFIGFGGICVHFQIYGITKELGISKIKFTVLRLIQGIVCACYMGILLIFFPISTETFSNLTERVNPALSGTYWGAAAIIMLSIIFLISIGHNNKQEVNLCAE